MKPKPASANVPTSARSVADAQALAGEPLRPFSNGTEYMMFQDACCERCAKGDDYHAAESAGYVAKRLREAAAEIEATQ